MAASAHFPRYFDVETDSDLEQSMIQHRRTTGGLSAGTAKRLFLAAGLASAAAVALLSTRHGKATLEASSNFLQLVEKDDETKRGAPEETFSPLKPLELLHDGNVCDTNEESFGGLCYKKCELLTQGHATIRSSPWTCCEKKPCGFASEHASGAPLPCKGYDVSGSGACPHKPGACLVDEELYLGQCYKKCSILTTQEYPHRVAPATCCKSSGIGCLNFKNDKTNPDFAVGGGAGDNDTSTPSTPHFPDADLTEDGSSKGKTESNPSIRDLFLPKFDVQKGVPQGNLDPHENMTDGNICNDNEEIHGGLCYKKCSVLTQGQAAIRTSPWTCCESHPCGIRNQHGEIRSGLLCKGYDVSGTDGCPHKPGACLVDEEMFLGVCYKQCKLLTNNKYPFRIGAASCCNSKFKLRCLNPMNDLTTGSLDVGGSDDGDEARAHLPEMRLTEKVDEEAKDEFKLKIQDLA